MKISAYSIIRYIVLPAFSKRYIVLPVYFIFSLEGILATFFIIFFDENVENIFLNEMIPVKLRTSCLKAISRNLNEFI